MYFFTCMKQAADLIHKKQQKQKKLHYNTLESCKQSIFIYFI